MHEIRKYRRYDQNSFTDLLRFIRNKKNHYRELSDEVKQLLGSTNDSFLHYFITKFPKLMIAVDEFVRSKLVDDPIFAQYQNSEF